MSLPHALPLTAVLLLGAALLQGCGDCGCHEQYEKCIDESPPGASRADCSEKLDACEDACGQSRN